MSITTSQLQGKIDDAITAAGLTWSKAQEDVLKELSQHNALLGLPAMFRAAAWLNTGIGATKTLFPASALAGVITRLSIPLAITNYAMSAFQSAYEGEVERKNALLAIDYQNIKDELVNAIRRAPHHVGNTPFGRNLAAAIHQAVAHRTADFVDEKQAYTHCYSMAEHAEHGLIETDIGAIRARSSEGFRTLCDKIHIVHRATNSGQRTLMRVDPGVPDCYTNIFAHGNPPVERTDPFTGRTAHCGPTFELLARGNFKQQGQIVELLANIGSYDIMQLKGWLSEEVYVRPGARSAVLEDMPESYARTGVKDVFESMKRADQAAWSQTMGGMMGKRA
jgi:hypothetical protein